MKTEDKILDLEFYSDFFFEKDCPICIIKAHQKPHDPFYCLRWYIILDIIGDNEEGDMSTDVIKAHVERKFQMILAQMKEFAKEQTGMKGHSTEEILKKFKK